MMWNLTECWQLDELTTAQMLIARVVNSASKAVVKSLVAID